MHVIKNLLWIKHIESYANEEETGSGGNFVFDRNVKGTVDCKEKEYRGFAIGQRLEKINGNDEKRGNSASLDTPGKEQHLKRTFSWVWLKRRKKEEDREGSLRIDLKNEVNAAPLKK